MEAHAICLNGSVEYVVVGFKERAEEVLLELKEAHFAHTKGVFEAALSAPHYDFNENVCAHSRKEYEARCRWHIRTVEAEIQLEGA